MKKVSLVLAITALVLAILALSLVLASRAEAATAVTLVGTLSWSEVEGRHVQLTQSDGSYWAVIPATPAIQATLEAGATAGKHAWVGGHEAEVSYYGVHTLIVYQVRVCPH